LTFVRFVEINPRQTGIVKVGYLFVEGSTEIEETDIFDTSKIVEKY
jgi:hypothetical protein